MKYLFRKHRNTGARGDEFIYCVCSTDFTSVSMTLGADGSTVHVLSMLGEASKVWDWMGYWLLRKLTAPSVERQPTDPPQGMEGCISGMSAQLHQWNVSSAYWPSSGDGGLHPSGGPLSHSPVDDELVVVGAWLETREGEEEVAW